MAEARELPAAPPAPALPPPDWQLHNDTPGEAHALGPLTLSVLGAGARVWKRNAMKNALGTGTRHERWLVGELDGVRVYVQGTRLVMTREDLYP